MDLLTIGLICILAAIVGGGLKGLGLEFPIIPARRQLLLGITGCVLVIISQASKIAEYMNHPAPPPVQPSVKTQLTIPEPSVTVTSQRRSDMSTPKVTIGKAIQNADSQGNPSANPTRAPSGSDSVSIILFGGK